MYLSAHTVRKLMPVQLTPNHKFEQELVLEHFHTREASHKFVAKTTPCKTPCLWPRNCTHALFPFIHLSKTRNFDTLDLPSCLTVTQLLPFCIVRSNVTSVRSWASPSLPCFCVDRCCTAQPCFILGMKLVYFSTGTGKTHAVGENRLSDILFRCSLGWRSFEGKFFISIWVQNGSYFHIIL